MNAAHPVARRRGAFLAVRPVALSLSPHCRRCPDVRSNLRMVTPCRRGIRVSRARFPAMAKAALRSGGLFDLNRESGSAPLCVPQQWIMFRKFCKKPSRKFDRVMSFGFANNHPLNRKGRHRAGSAFLRLFEGPILVVIPSSMNRPGMKKFRKLRMPTLSVKATATSTRTDPSIIR